MTRIMVINCNTSKDMTRDICESAHRCAATDTRVECVNPSTGPSTIEGFYDSVMALQGMMQIVREAETQSRVDAYIVGCFCDAGLYAMREITDKPVVGLMEASMTLASFVAGRFSIVSVQPRIQMMLEEGARRVGLERRLASIRTVVFKVGDIHGSAIAFERAVVAESKEAVEKDHAEAIIVGCAGAGPVVDAVGRATGVPVVDPVVAAVKIAEGLVGMNLRTSKSCSYMYPEKKPYKGMAEILQP